MSFNPKHIELLRQKIDLSNWPLDMDTWPTELNQRTNSLAFALGITMPATSCSVYTPEELKNYIMDFCSALELDCRDLSSIDEAEPDEIILLCYENLLGGKFHIIRRNLNGKWVHKESWNEAPCEVLDIGFFHCLYPPTCKSMILAVKKRTS